MRKFLFLPGLMIMMLFLCTSCTFHTYHFGVANRAATVPDDFGETEAAIARAEQSEGAKYCPEKIARAKELAHDGAAIYWTCQNTASSKLLAEARELAKEAEECGPKAAAAAPAPIELPVPACTLAVSPTYIDKGKTAKLSWSSQNSTRCNIKPNIGPVDPQGSMTITPSADTVYTLTCSGEGGKATSDARITVESPAPPAPSREELCMALHIEFDTDKAVINSAYFKEVEKVADFMHQYPQVKGAIEGHTDNVGGANYNLRLSQRRAESIVKMLVETYGIDKSRLSAKGYGLTKPISDNRSAAGKQKNRRTVANFGCVSVEK
jgi:outer membrane protein OmpA-like peptidoglycan-associated protein